MAHNVLVNVDDITLNDGTFNTGDTLTISNEEFSSLTGAGRFTDGTLTDQGATPDDESDEVFDRVAAPAMTATAIAAANATTPANAVYTAADITAIADLLNEVKADYAALRADVLALRTALTGSGRPLS